MSLLTNLSTALGIDSYTIRARIQPAMLVVLPLALCVVVLDPSKFLLGTVGWSLIAWAGGTALLTQLGRDWGRKKEPKLFATWDGKPTSKAQRLRETSNLSLLKHRRERILILFSSIQLPTSDQESHDPATADEAYDAISTQLRNRTRDRLKFPLIFEENCNYGFRRNLWGMKPIGIVGCAIALAVIVGRVVLFGIHRLDVTLIPALSAGAFSLLLLLLWVILIRPSWVRVPADAYAERLLESLDTLK